MPFTTNTILNVPNTGDLVGIWGSAAVNPDFNAIDGYLGGVQTLSVSSANIALTAPSVGSPTPSGGPTQAQNAVLRFTGTLTVNVQVTLPLPGYYIVENLTSASAQVLILRAAGSGEVICIDRGDVQHVYNDGTNVRFVNMGRVGHIEMWAGLSSMPAWVTLCTKRPFLLCDGAVYNFSDYPYLGARLGSSFGGNGSTTFGVPDLRGRQPLPYDGTGTRITTAVCGINGQTIGAAADNQGVTLLATQIPSITSTTGGAISVASQNGLTGIPVTANAANVSRTGVPSGAASSFSPSSSAASWVGVDSLSTAGAVLSASNNTGGAVHSNVQPSQVTGIAVIKAA